MPTIFIILIAVAVLVFIVMAVILVKSISNKEGTGLEPHVNDEPLLPTPKQPKLPIEKVKVFFNQDLENLGYAGAQSNSDTGFKQQKVLELKEQGKQECISAINEYEDKIADIDANIVIYTNAVLLDTVERLKAQKIRYQNDIVRITQMQAEFANDNLKVYASYCRGFARWQKAKAEGLINDNE